MPDKSNYVLGIIFFDNGLVETVKIQQQTNCKLYRWLLLIVFIRAINSFNIIAGTSIYQIEEEEWLVLARYQQLEDNQMIREMFLGVEVINWVETREKNFQITFAYLTYL